jgi:hypothetical protein
MHCTSERFSLPIYKKVDYGCEGIYKEKIDVKKTVNVINWNSFYI